eukprot:TRINITY_DN65183_c0_g1_i1.p1 TRINITY_DN65183_c0_g1~~TRINITY_DN65183_c0_g1_i1.p1  ORF type:complete len:412 (+),score=56.41 TRINITY_DN65183_c0_g1_i1:43-1236(+)
MALVDSWTAESPSAQWAPLRVATWNVLSEAYETGTGGYWEHWDNRKDKLIEHIVNLQADVLCLQEVDHFDFFNDQLKLHGYTGFWVPKTKWPVWRIDRDHEVLNEESFMKKHQDSGQKGLKREWKSLPFYLPTEGQATFVHTGRWRIRRWLCWHGYTFEDKSRDLKRTWERWLCRCGAEAPAEVVNAEEAQGELLNQNGVCPLPQVALGVEVLPAASTDETTGVCVLNLHLKSNPVGIAKAYSCHPHSECVGQIKQAQLRLFLNSALACIAASSRLLVCGDFNQRPSPEDLQALALIDAHEGHVPKGVRRLPIDFILLQDCKELRLHEVLALPGFDHWCPTETHPSDHAARAMCAMLRIASDDAAGRQSADGAVMDDGRSPPLVTSAAAAVQAWHSS